MTKLQLEKLCKNGQSVTAFERVVIGQNEQGFDTYKIVYIDTPLNYKLIHIDDESKLCILEDLDYKDPIIETIA